MRLATIVAGSRLSTFSPGRAAVLAAEDVATQAADEDRVACVHDGEQAAAVIHRHGVEARRGGIEPERHATLARNVQAASRGRMAYRFMKRGFDARSNHDCQVRPPSLVSKIRL